MKNLLTDIGSCGYCIRTAFRMTLVASAIVGLAWLSGNAPARLLAAAAWALFASLWVLHVVVFALRTAKRQVARAPGTRLSHRRAFMGSFIRTGAAVAALTAIGAVIPRAAFAQQDDHERENNCRNAKFRCTNRCVNEQFRCRSRCEQVGGFAGLQCLAQCESDHDSCKSECEDQESDCNNG